MVHNVDAIYDQGVFRPIAPPAIPPGTRVHLRVEAEEIPEATDELQTTEEVSGSEVPSLLERLRDFVGVVDDLPPDASVNLDHYRYGTPKRK